MNTSRSTAEGTITVNEDGQIVLKTGVLTTEGWPDVVVKVAECAMWASIVWACAWLWRDR